MFEPEWIVNVYAKGFDNTSDPMIYRNNRDATAETVHELMYSRMVKNRELLNVKQLNYI